MRLEAKRAAREHGLKAVGLAILAQIRSLPEDALHAVSVRAGRAHLVGAAEVAV